jgi:hypothetical protein
LYSFQTASRLAFITKKEFAAELCQRNLVPDVLRRRHKALLFLSQRLLKTLTIQGFTNQIVKDLCPQSALSVTKWLKENSLKSKHSDNLRCGCAGCVAAIRE